MIDIYVDNPEDATAQILSAARKPVQVTVWKPYSDQVTILNGYMVEENDDGIRISTSPVAESDEIQATFLKRDVTIRRLS